MSPLCSDARPEPRSKTCYTWSVIPWPLGKPHEEAREMTKAKKYATLLLGLAIVLAPIATATAAGMPRKLTCSGVLVEKDGDLQLKPDPGSELWCDASFEVGITARFHFDKWPLVSYSLRVTTMSRAIDPIGDRYWLWRPPAWSNAGAERVSEVNCHVATRRRLEQSGTKLPPSGPRGPRLAQPPCHRGAPSRHAATSVRSERRQSG